MAKDPDEIAKKYGGQSTQEDPADVVARKYGGSVAPEQVAAAPDQPPTWADKLSLGGTSPLSGVARGTVDFLEGGAAGLAKTIYGGGDLLRRLTGSKRIINDPGVQQNMMVPESLPGKAGEFAAEAAPYFIPGAAATKGATLLGKAIPALATKGVQLGTKAVLEGAGMGTLSAAQGASPTGVGINTVLGMTSPYAGVVAKAISENWPASIVNNMLRPFEKQFRFGKNAGQGIVDEGILAASKGRLLNQVRAAKSRVGQEIGNTLQTAKAQAGPGIDINAQLGAIDDAITEAVKGGRANQPIVDQLNAFRESLTNESVLNPKGQIIAGSPRAAMNPEQATALKRTIGENTRWTGEAYDEPLNAAKSQTYGKLRSEIEREVPQVESLNEHYSNLLEAEKIAKRRANANPNLRASEIGLGIIGEGAMPHAGIGAFLTALAGRTAPGATGLAQIVKRSPEIGMTLKDLVAAFVASLGQKNTGHNLPPTE
jgi:hypothetical protein